MLFVIAASYCCASFQIAMRQILEMCTDTFAQEIPGIPGQGLGLDIIFIPCLTHLSTTLQYDMNQD